MRKITLLLLVMAALAIQSWAGPIDESTARMIAQRFMNNGSPSLRASSGSSLHLLRAEMGKAKVNQPVFYIYNTATSFLVIAGDDRAEEILMVGDHPIMDINNLAPGMKDMLDQYKEEMEFLQEHPKLQVEKSTPRNTSLQANVYGPLMTALWNQREPYWNKCQFDYEGTTYQCYTGCPATSSAMVLYYWKHPKARVAAIDSYTSTLSLTSEVEVDYTYPALPATTFDWDNMKDSYDTYTTAQGNAVATLMRYVGQAVEMMYGTVSAGGSGIYNSDAQKLVDMFTRFGYDATTCRLVQKSFYIGTTWESLIQKEIIEGRPVVYLAVAPTQGGHAFNVDGYRDTDNKYHVNFGWGGIGNSWCAMNAFAYADYTFSRNQQAIIGIQPAQTPEPDPEPDPELTVAPGSLSFRAVTGETASKTFTVSGSDLLSDLTLTLNDDSGNYAIDKTAITAAEAASGATVTVTYSPTAVGPSKASVTVSGGGVEAQHVALEGEAIEANVIYVDATKLTFPSTYTGYASWTDITITGIVSENIELSWNNNSRPGFGLSKTTITPQQAAAGIEVRVYYQPTWTSYDRNTLIIKSEGAETVYIPVSGTKIHSDGYITAWPTTLSFETQVGVPVTQTFTLHFSKSNGNDAIMISDVDGDEVTGFNLGSDGVMINGSSSGAGSLTPQGGNKGNPSKPLVPCDDLSDSFSPGTFPLLQFGLNLNITGDNGFSVSPTSLSIAKATGGYEVTVTYLPEAIGTHEATLTITSRLYVAKPLVMKLYGTATADGNSVMLGDVNATGTVDVTDVTDLIDMLLNGAEPNARADVNQDNQLNISDISSLLDLLFK